MTRSVKVTVVKRGLDRELIDRLVPEQTSIERCSALEDGQEFLFEDWPSRPTGFCDLAWQAIHVGLMLCWFDADLGSVTIPNKWQACCPDGLRPVVFLIEPIESGSSAVGPEQEEEVR
jgi:uncharacterized repeat protein (TIGR04076 family)